jgi:hypothetical protein
MEALFIFVGAVGCAIGLIIFGTLWRGFVASKLWLWFVVPQFGLAPLPIAIAIGLSTLVALFTPSRPSDPDKSEQLGKQVAHVFMLPALVLLVGWVVLQFK